MRVISAVCGSPDWRQTPSWDISSSIWQRAGARGGPGVSLCFPWGSPISFNSGARKGKDLMGWGGLTMMERGFLEASLMP